MPQQDNYIVKIQQMWQAGTLPRDVGLHQVSVSHDDWCGIFQQQRCDCDPDVQLKYSLPTAGQN
jgi:hypothetical protein